MNTISTKIKVSLNIPWYYSYVESTYVSRLLTIELTKETQLSLGTDSVLLWNLGISRMYMKIQNETKYVCHVMAPNDRFGGNLHTETREERFDLL